MLPLLVQLEKVSLLTFLVSSMLAMGLTLTVQAVVAPLCDARLVIRALLLNFAFAPAFAWLLTVVIPLQRGHAIGLLLLGGVAGAPFLPKVVESARGNAALAAALMSLLTFGTILFLPFALPLMIPGLQANPWTIARPLILFIVLPFVAGMGMKRAWATVAGRAAPVLARIGSASLLLLVVLLLALNVRVLLGVIGSGAILATLLFFVGLFWGGWLLGGTGAQERGALGLATTARNFGAALAPASTSFDDPQVVVMIIVGAIVCILVSFLAARWVRRGTISNPG